MWCSSTALDHPCWTALAAYHSRVGRSWKRSMRTMMWPHGNCPRTGCWTGAAQRRRVPGRVLKGGETCACRRSGLRRGHGDVGAVRSAASRNWAWVRDDNQIGHDGSPSNVGGGLDKELVDTGRPVGAARLGSPRWQAHGPASVPRPTQVSAASFAAAACPSGPLGGELCKAVLHGPFVQQLLLTNPASRAKISRLARPRHRLRSHAARRQERRAAPSPGIRSRSLYPDSRQLARHPEGRRHRTGAGASRVSSSWSRGMCG